MRRFSSLLSKLPAPLIFFMVCFLAYGLLIPWLGFYLDDWYIILFQKYFGSGNFSLFFENDRPLFAYVYDIFVPIFKDSKLAWQIFVLITHTLAVSCFWWLLIKLMPTNRKLALVAALFFAVYPGFQFHWFSVMYGQVFLLYAVYFLSYILMVYAVNAERRKLFYWLGAGLCLIIGVVPQETFIGLELARLIVLWVVLAQRYPDHGKRLKRTLLFWLPFLMIVTGFVFYRLGNAASFSYQASLFSDLSARPLDTIARLFTEVFWGAVDALLTAWINLIRLLKRDLLSFVSAVMIVVIVIGGGLNYFYLKGKKEDEVQPYQNRWVLWASLLITISAMAPFLAGSFKINLDFPNNRYLIALAPGACLFLAAAIDALLRTDKQKLIISSVLIGFAIGSHFMTARSFMLTWQAQQDFFWQLSWRAPEIKDNTALVTEDLPFSDYFSGTSLTAPINLIYASERNSHQIPYLFVLMTQQNEVIPVVKSDQPIDYSFRSFIFTGNTSEMLLFTKPSDGCLRIYSTQDSSIEHIYSQRYSFWQSAIPLSNLGRIIPDPEIPAIPPRKYFGAEDRNQWCYYFEKADLARQQQDWAKVVGYYQDAQAAGFKPLLDSEWLPLMDAYIQLNELDKALEITKTINDFDQTTTAGFCKLWTVAKEDESVISYSEEAQSWLRCKVSNEE